MLITLTSQYKNKDIETTGDMENIIPKHIHKTNGNLPNKITIRNEGGFSIQMEFRRANNKPVDLAELYGEAIHEFKVGAASA